MSNAISLSFPLLNTSLYMFSNERRTFSRVYVFIYFRVMLVVGQLFGISPTVVKHYRPNIVQCKPGPEIPRGIDLYDIHIYIYTI